MTDEELYDSAQEIWGAVEKGGWDTAVAAARRLADRAVAEVVRSTSNASADQGEISGRRPGTT